MEVQGKLQVKSRLQAASAFTAQPLLSQAGGRAVVTGRRRRYVPQTLIGSGVSARLPGVPVTCHCHCHYRVLAYYVINSEVASYTRPLVYVCINLFKCHVMSQSLFIYTFPPTSSEMVT